MGSRRTTTAGTGGFATGFAAEPRATQPAHARLHNRALLLQHAIDSGPVSRAQLARSSGLTATTVTGIVGELIDDGILEEVGRESTGSVGKPATLVSVVPDGRHTLCIDLSDDDKVVGAIVDLAGKVIQRQVVDRKAEKGPAATRLVERLARDLQAAATAPVLGLGIGTPGVVDDHGTVVHGAHLDWHDEPVGATLRDALGIPVHVVNDANAAVLAEYSFGGSTSDNVVLVRVAQGVGAGLLLRGELFVGDHFAAGEIGHVIVDDKGPECACGRHGCLEAVVSSSLLAQRSAGLDERARGRLLQRAGRHLGLALTTVVSALNLTEIVLSGPTDLLDDRTRVAALDTIRQRTIPAIGNHVDLRFSSLGDDDVVLGAAVLVLRHELGVVF